MLTDDLLRSVPDLGRVPVKHSDSSAHVGSLPRVHEIQSAEFTGKHTTGIETIAISERYRCIATGSVDGYLNIWDLNGLHLHTIHLQVCQPRIFNTQLVFHGSG